MLMEEVHCLPQYFGSCYLIEIMTLLRISPVDNFGVTAACIATKYGCIAHVNEIIFPPMLNEQELEPTPFNTKPIGSPPPNSLATVIRESLDAKAIVR